jgi:hypothetical protein
MARALLSQKPVVPGGPGVVYGTLRCTVRDLTQAYNCAQAADLYEDLLGRVGDEFRQAAVTTAPSSRATN